MTSLIEILPEVRGSYRANAILSKTNWFGVGGPAEILYKPADSTDLAFFLKNKPKNIPVTVIGVGSNLLVRDQGIRGVVVKLGKGFTDISHQGEIISAGAAALDYNVAQYAMSNLLGGLEFLVGIPGAIGGAIAMNAGAYGGDMAKVLLSAEAVDDKGNIIELSNQDFGFVYRGNKLPKNLIFTKAILQASSSVAEIIKAKMDEINQKREATQPIKTRTSGSTFANPQGKKAWELIDQAGCRGLRIGGAVISDKHCNFLINDNNASASDLENLGEEVRRRVFDKTGIMLEWEVQIMGEK